MIFDRMRPQYGPQAQGGPRYQSVFDREALADTGGGMGRVRRPMMTGGNFTTGGPGQSFQSPQFQTGGNTPPVVASQFNTGGPGQQFRAPSFMTGGNTPPMQTLGLQTGGQLPPMQQGWMTGGNQPPQFMGQPTALGMLYRRGAY